MERTNQDKAEELADRLLDQFDRYKPELVYDDEGRIIAIQLTVPLTVAVKTFDDTDKEPYARVGNG